MSREEGFPITEELASAFGNPSCSINSLGKPGRVHRPLQISMWGN